ncbi:MAG: DUF2335 domain-containing protein [Alphaproteobacteria bacterium]|nr:DUF2335 domain-containing protein [Alphaproteobacteria bacterium]
MAEEGEPGGYKSREERPFRTGGYIRQKPETSRGEHGRAKDRVVEFLPAPEVLESYNYVVDGSAKMILSMFEREQNHRHDWERMALRIYSFSSILGQLLGFFIAVSVFASATMIGVYGNTTIAAFIWVFGMAIVVMAGLVWAYAKSMGQRPLFARPAMRAHFRPMKEKAEDGAGQGQ